jgi:hypothetical protein
MAVFIGAVRSGRARKRRKPSGDVISTMTARKIAMDYHGGQWSALYQFGSSGVYIDNFYEMYISEIDADLARVPSNRKSLADRYLKALKKYFRYKYWEYDNK